MPSFRGLPPSLRPVVRPKPTHTDAKSIHVPVARAMVDCGIYVDGQRAPGKYTHAGALNKVHELEREGKEAFVWIGRPFKYAAAIGGHEGVRHAIELMRAEIQRDMMMLGIRALDELGPHSVRRVDGTGITPSCERRFP